MALEPKEAKRALRREVRQALSALPLEYFAACTEGILARLTALPEYIAAQTIFCFVGTPGEIDTLPFLRDALRRGKRLCTPACVAPGRMELRLTLSVEALASGAFGIREAPRDAALIRPCEVDFAVIPCLCCGHDGSRLGKGGGYYDRFLAEYRGAAALVCPELLTRSEIPMEAHDIPVLPVVTEAGIFRGA